MLKLFCPKCNTNVPLYRQSIVNENKTETYRQANNRYNYKDNLVPFIIIEIFIKCKHCHRELKYKRIQVGLNSMEERFK